MRRLVTPASGPGGYWAAGATEPAKTRKDGRGGPINRGLSD